MHGLSKPSKEIDRVPSFTLLCKKECKKSKQGTPNRMLLIMA